MQREELIGRVKLHLGEYLEQDISHASLDTQLASIAPNLDSLKLFEAMLYLEDCLHIRIPENALEELHTFGDVVSLIESAPPLEGITTDAGAS